MNTEHPITPPPELVKQWEDDILNERDNVDHVLDCAWRDGYRARALLAEPEPKGPTDEELWALGNDDFRGNCYPTDAIRFARAVLDKWGRQ